MGHGWLAVGRIYLLSWGSQVLTIWSTPQAELLHPSIHQHRVSVPGCWARHCGPCRDYSSLPALGEVVGNQGGRSGGDGPETRNWVLNYEEIMGEAEGGALGFRPALFAGYSLPEGTWLKNEWDRNPACAPFTNPCILTSYLGGVSVSNLNTDASWASSGLDPYGLEDGEWAILSILQLSTPCPLCVSLPLVYPPTFS